jgi:hypothetical protein
MDRGTSAFIYYLAVHVKAVCFRHHLSMFFIDKCPNPMGVDIAHFEKKLTLTIHH